MSRSPNRKRMAGGLCCLLLPVLFAGCAASRPVEEDRVDAILREYQASLRDRAADAPVAAPPAVRGSLPPAATAAAPAPLRGVEPGVATLPPQDVEPRDVIKPSQFLQQGMVTIQPETVVNIAVKEDGTLNGAYRVDESGAIQFKYVGLMFLDNLTPRQAEERIRERLEGAYMRSASVKVDIIQASFDSVRVVGLVNKPGNLRIGAGSAIPLNQALLRADGVKSLSRNLKARIVRGGMLSPLPLGEESELYALVDDAGSSAVPDVELRNKDMVFVFETGVSGGRPGAQPGGHRQVLMLGEVNQQGYIAFAPEERCSVLHLALKVGGFPRWAKTSKVEVVRRGPSGSREIYVVNADRVLASGEDEDDFLLEDGDIVRVPARTFGF